VSNTAWLVIALAVVFVAIAGYSAGLMIRQARLTERLDKLTRDGH